MASRINANRIQTSKSVQQAVNSITPPGQLRRMVDGAEEAREIVSECLEEADLDYTFVNTVIGGSIAKDTQYYYNRRHQSDVDLVSMLEVRNEDYPAFFDHIPGNIQSVLRRSRRIRNVDFHGAIGIVCEINGFSVDIVPAVHFSDNEYQQKIQTWHEIEEADPDTPRLFSAGLVNTGVALYQTLPKFWHTGTRALRSWKAESGITNFYGCKPLLDTVAMQVCNEVQADINAGGGYRRERGQRKRFYWFCRQAMDKIIHLDTTSVIVTGEYTWDEIPAQFLNPGNPVVLDLINPFNNLLAEADEHIIREWHHAAFQTLGRLDNFTEYTDENWEQLCQYIRP